MVEFKGTALKYLNNNPLLHACMIDSIKRGASHVLYAAEDGALAYDAAAQTHMLSAACEESAGRMIGMLDSSVVMLVLYQPRYSARARAVLGMKGEEMLCVNAVYTRDTPVGAPHPGIDIVRLAPEDAAFVAGHYSQIDDVGHIRERIEAGMFGAIVDGAMAGFIGTHTEGSMGMLEILPQFRRRGIAYALEAHMIDHLLAQGRTPYGQIVVGNEASLGLQRRLHMDISKDGLVWLFRD